MSILGNIVGGIAKKVFKKGTIVGNLIGATGVKKKAAAKISTTQGSKPQPIGVTGSGQTTTQPTQSLLQKLGISGGLTFGANKLAKYVIGGILFLAALAIIFVMRKRKRKRR